MRKWDALVHTGISVYRTIWHSCAVYLRGIIRQHPPFLSTILHGGKLPQQIRLKYGRTWSDHYVWVSYQYTRWSRGEPSGEWSRSRTTHTYNDIIQPCHIHAVMKWQPWSSLRQPVPGTAVTTIHWSAQRGVWQLRLSDSLSLDCWAGSWGV